MSVTSIQRKLQNGYQRHLAGDTTTAARLYAEVLQADPQNADAWHLSGLIAFRRGQLDDAEQLLQQAIQLRPSEPSYQSNMAAVLLATDRSLEAEHHCRQVLRLDPHHVDALKHLGTALRKQNRSLEAFDVYQTVASKAPTDADTLCNLGAVLTDIGRIDEAHQTLLQARNLNARLPQIHLNLGAVQRQLGQFSDAMCSLDRAAELAPDLAEAFTNRGNLLLEMGQPAQALAEFQKALQQTARSVTALSGLGQCLQVLGRWSEAMEAFRIASSLTSSISLQTSSVHPSSVHTPLADAADGFQTTVAPLSDLQSKAIRHDAGSAVHQRLRSNYLYCASLASGHCRATTAQLHFDWGRSVEQSVRPFVHPQRTDSEKRLKIGYLSPDFRSHATMRFFLPFFEAHDRAVVETFCYSESVRIDDLTYRVRAFSDAWRPTHGLTDQQVADVIRADEIDILIDLAGHTAGNRLSAMAYKPAPVQVSFLGYPNTTGLTRVDYFLIDAIRESEASAGLFTEQLIAMPHGAACFQPGYASAAVAEPPLFSNGFITLGSTHRLEKLSSECLQLWAVLMHEIPDARLLLARDVLRSSATVRDHLLQRLTDVGIDLRRVQLEGDIPPCHLDLYARMDILLDVFPWPSGTTCYEATWMGVPMPTMAGQQQFSLSSASFLHHIGCPHLIARTPEHYIELVANLAMDIAQLCELRRTLRTQMRETVCDGRRFARDLEAILRGLWRRHCGMHPADCGVHFIGQPATSPQSDWHMSNQQPSRTPNEASQCQ